MSKCKLTHHKFLFPTQRRTLHAHSTQQTTKHLHERVHREHYSILYVAGYENVGKISKQSQSRKKSFSRTAGFCWSATGIQLHYLMCTRSKSEEVVVNGASCGGCNDISINA